MSFFDEIKNTFIELFNSFKNEIIKEIILIKNFPNDREKELEEENNILKQEILLLRQELEILTFTCEMPSNFIEIKDDTILSEIEPWELFNTNTKIKIMIGNNYGAIIDVTNKKIIFRNRNFTSLANIIELIKQIENINPKRKYNPYNFVDWYNEKTKIWTSASYTFTKKFLKENGKQN
jgi:hypothetical protein